MALWNDLIPRLHRPRQLVDRRSTTSRPSTARQSSTSPASWPTVDDVSTMERDGLMSAVGQDRKSHDLQRDVDVIVDDSGGSSTDDDDDDDDSVTVSFGLAMMVGCILLLLNAIVFVGTMCQWPRLRRRRRRRRKQQHAAALAALTSYPVDNRKSDGDVTSPLTRLYPDEHTSGVRPCDSVAACQCTRTDETATDFCDQPCSSTLNVAIASSSRSLTNSPLQANHVYARNQFTAV